MIGFEDSKWSHSLSVSYGVKCLEIRKICSTTHSLLIIAEDVMRMAFQKNG